MNAISVLASSVYSAIIKDLPEVEYFWVSPMECKKHSVTPSTARELGLGELRKCRPREDQCEVYLFPQTWGSTALGFGGVGGAAMTTAYTVIVVHDNAAAVYFGGGLAYVVTKPNSLFFEDIKNHSIAAVRGQYRYSSEGVPSPLPGGGK
jgi:hypothetical protein